MSHADQIEAMGDACGKQPECVATYLRERIKVLAPHARAAVGLKFIDVIEESCVMLDRQALEIKAIQTANQMFVEYEKRVEKQLTYKDKSIRGLKDKKKQQAHELTRLAALRQKHERKYATVKGQLKEQAERLKAHAECQEDVRRLTKELDDILSGEGAAERPMLCDVVKTARDVMESVKAKDEAIKSIRGILPAQKKHLDGNEWSELHIRLAAIFDYVEKALKGSD